MSKTTVNIPFPYAKGTITLISNETINLPLSPFFKRCRAYALEGEGTIKVAPSDGFDFVTVDNISAPNSVEVPTIGVIRVETTGVILVVAGDWKLSGVELGIKGLTDSRVLWLYDSGILEVQQGWKSAFDAKSVAVLPILQAVLKAFYVNNFLTDKDLTLTVVEKETEIGGLPVSYNEATGIEEEISPLSGLDGTLKKVEKLLTKKLGFKMVLRPPTVTAYLTLPDDPTSAKETLINAINSVTIVKAILKLVGVSLTVAKVICR